MPFLSTPTQTADTYQANDNRPEPPVITAVARQAETSSFVLGPDTCGFTSGSTRYECENVDSYRGCCIAGAEDCSAAIYTTCLDYDEMPNAAFCGPRTLCCPLSKAFCATYGFTTEEQPGATFTHIGCAESPVFGELYPYPPELGAMTETSSVEKISSALVVQPADNTGSSSSRSISPGAIAGAVVGSVIFALLAILGIFFIIKRRRRRQWEQRIHNGSGATSAPCPSTEGVHFGGGASAGGLRPLSTIHEREMPSPGSASSGEKRRSASSPLQPPIFAPNWPLGGPISPRKPLSSHPVTDLERRLSRDGFPPQPQPNRYMRTDVPILKTPTPPPFGTHLSPPPPLRKPRPALLTGGGSSTSTVDLALQSPRLSYIPTPTIDEAFGGDIRKTLNGVGDSDHDTLNRNDSTLPLLATAVPWPAATNTTTGTRSKRFTNHGLYINPNLEISRPNNDARSVSSLDGTGQRELDDIVSPMSPGDTEPGVSPLTVSPIESQRGSFGV
ncbi:hypothetical protein GGR58DRAFT_522706 [Xylaria digitata]|nr:hypothetical protein GGR58DRAFT_522706 [Xylaria digitata]